MIRTTLWVLRSSPSAPASTAAPDGTSDAPPTDASAEVAAQLAEEPQTCWRSTRSEEVWQPAAVFFCGARHAFRVNESRNGTEALWPRKGCAPGLGF